MLSLTILSADHGDGNVTGRRPIGLAAQNVPGLPPEETIRIAAAAGFDLVGITIDPAGWTPARAAEVRRIAAGEGIGLNDAEVIRLRRADDSADHALIDHTAAAGAAHVLIVGFMADRAALIDAMTRLVERADQAGVRAILEFGAFTDVPSLAAALEIAREVPGLAILVDPLHLHRSGGTPREVAAVPPDLLPYAQWCDAERANSVADRDELLLEARDRRLDIGEGVLPLAELLKALPANLPLITEVRSLAVAARFPDPLDHARHLRTSLADWLQAQGEGF